MSSGRVIGAALVLAAFTYLSLALPPTILACSGRRQSFALPLLLTVSLSLLVDGTLALRGLIAGEPVSFLGRTMSRSS